jgi:hypothetical protein
MSLAHARLLGAGLATTLALATAAVPPAAHAATALTTASLSSYAFQDVEGPCEQTDPADLPAQVVGVAENGPPASITDTVTRTFADPADTSEPARSVTTTTTLRGTASVASTAGLPTSLTLDVSGTASALPSDPPPDCRAGMVLGADLLADFTLASPLWATLAVSGQGPGQGTIDIFRAGAADPTWSLPRAGSVTVLVPAGSYEAHLAADTDFPSDTAAAATRSASLSVTFVVPGSATTAPSGRASRYVALPGARSCPTHDVTARLTARTKRIKQLRKVTFAVNGTRVATLRGRKLRKGRAVVLPLADNAPAVLTATAALRNGRKRTVVASYRTCNV